MRGGRNLKIEDFEKRDGDHEFRIDTSIGLEPYIFFGNINYLGKDAYNYVIFCENGFGGKVLIRDNNFLLNKYKLEDKLKDEYFIKLLRELKKYLENFNGFRRIKSYLNTIIPVNSSPANVIESSSAHVRENGSAQGNRNDPAQVSKPIILSNGCIEYPANYQFSGKNKNGNPYNTNKLFRGTGINHLYLYDPRKGKYELLLTELDYLVNVYDTRGKPFMITYSGVFQPQFQTEPSQIQAGKTKIPITDIDHYLYCSNMDEFPKEKYNIRPIYIKELWQNTTTYHNVDINDDIKFPCWIIFKKKPSQENNFNNSLKQQQKELW